MRPALVAAVALSMTVTTVPVTAEEVCYPPNNGHVRICVGLDSIETGYLYEAPPIQPMEPNGWPDQLWVFTVDIERAGVPEPLTILTYSTDEHHECGDIDFAQVFECLGRNPLVPSTPVFWSANLVDGQIPLYTIYEGYVSYSVQGEGDRFPFPVIIPGGPL